MNKLLFEKDSLTKKSIFLAGLEHTAECGRQRMFSVLLQGSPSEDKEWGTQEMQNSFIWAANYGWLDLVKSLLSKGTEVDGVLMNQKGTKETALMKSAETGQLAVVKYLVEEKAANLELKDARGYRALEKAMWNYQRRVASYLDPITVRCVKKDKDLAHVEKAISEKNFGKVKAGISKLNKKYVYCLSRLVQRWNTVRNPDIATTDILELLLDIPKKMWDKGIDAIEINEEPILIKAAISNHLPLIKVLVKHGADVNILDSSGFSPYTIALLNNHAEILKYLSDEANVNHDLAEDSLIAALTKNGHIIGLEKYANIKRYLKLKPESSFALKFRKAMVKSCETDSSGALERLLQLSPSNTINTLRVRHDSLFQVAVKSLALESARLLKKMGANVNFTTDKGDTALHVLAKSLLPGNKDSGKKYFDDIDGPFLNVWNFLVNDTKIDLSIRNDDNNTAKDIMRSWEITERFPKLILRIFRDSLYETVMGGCTECIELLLKNGSELQLPESQIGGDDFEKAAFALVTKKLTKELDWLLDMAPTGAVDQYRDAKGNTLLMIASRWGQGEVLGTLFKRNPNFNLQNDNNSTVLHMAVHNGHLNDVKTLVETGKPDTFIKDKEGRTAYDLALNLTHQRIATYLEPISLAVMNGDIELARKILSLPNRFRIGSENFRNATLESADKCQLHILFRMLTMAPNGSVNTYRDESGNTVLMVASRNGSDDCFAVVKRLLRMNANVNILNNFNETALHLAVESENSDLVLHLVNNGANINIKNGDGLTSFDLASSANNTLHSDSHILGKLSNSTNQTLKGAKPSTVPPSTVPSIYWQDRTISRRSGTTVRDIKHFGHSNHSQISNSETSGHFLL